MMIKERMVRKGMIRDRKRASPEEKPEEKAKSEKKEDVKAQAGKAKRPTRRKRKEAPGQKESE
ncbi:MAG: hypothetical protein GKC09_08595 [Methanosarcinales archaeon]|nr:hypothetical protein [Methanosarcinales archaeon]